ncbi:pyridoxamine 5'-phosphate oxidase family protein [Auritidibacter ignavus]|uniref:pyridoxamine 5'-phosphate oxidase family protein n=1 Tax=Auritidibacter ignavus TaxID=678932 RepID=UPI00109D353D|nr:pyridoxamine 5'-phosphate oxidase family protein [Auritidibacter ignavus]
MTVETWRDGIWLESIGLFQQARAGNHQAAMRLLETSADPATTVHGLLRMLVVFLRDEDPDKMERFLDASLRAGAPPLGSPFVRDTAAFAEGFAGRLRGGFRLTGHMRALLETDIPVLATATPEGAPAVGPTSSLRIWDERTLFYYEPPTGRHLANFRAGSVATVAVIDQDNFTGYRFVGLPEVHHNGDVFEAAGTFARAQNVSPPAAAVLIHLHEVEMLDVSA